MPKAPAKVTIRDRLFGLLLALPFLLGGAFPIGIGLHWLPLDPAKVHAPGWVLVICGLVFLSAGLAIVAMAVRPGSNPVKVVSVVCVIGITAVTHWVAFGDGDRKFTHTRSINGIVVDSGPVDEGTGRTVFGIGAVLLDIGLVTLAAIRVRKRMSQP
jgi:hypothetical protein